MPPLSGIRVLDFSELAPGPYMTQCLHDMGAEVIKIERPNGDMARTLQPGGFAALNHGKHSRFLDPKDPDACREAVALAREVDVLVEGFQPRVLAKFGLS